MAKKILTFIFPFMVLLSSCLREEDATLPFETLVPRQLNDSWTVTTPESAGFDAEALTRVFEDFHSDRKMWQPRSLIVIKDGRLVAETYTKDRNDISTPAAVWSCTKQILAIITMKAIEEGVIPSLDLTVGEALPEYASAHPDKAPITLRQLMTMTSGIGFSNSGLNGDTNRLLRREPANSAEYILGLPMAATSGSTFNYSDGDPQLISAILSKAFGCSVEEWSRQRIFGAMGITGYDWLTYPDGLTMGAFGLRLTPRDLARFGQLILDNGDSNGTRIISEESVAALTQIRVDAGRVKYEDQAFGLLWWINPEDGTPYMHGQGGQYVMINREKRIVVCITSEPNTQGDSQFPLRSAFRLYRAILAACP